MEFLDFKAIAAAIQFQTVLDWLNIPYTQVDGEIRGEGFIITVSKNRYTNPVGSDYGNVINFLQAKKGMSAREAASLLKKTFLTNEKPAPTLPVYKLQYCKELEDLGISEETARKLEIGKVVEHKGKSAGKIAFRIRSVDGEPVGYCIFDPKKKEYFYYSQYKHDHIYNLNNVDQREKTAIMFADPINVAIHDKVCPFCIGMTRGNLTQAQTDLLKRFERILIIHHDEKQAQYLVNKLSKFVFVMATEGSQEDFDKFTHLLAMSKN